MQYGFFCEGGEIFRFCVVGIYIPQHNASTQDNRYDIGYIKAFIARYIAPCYTLPIVTEVMALQNFYEAEEYHQKYLQKNPNGYCHIDITGALRPLKRMDLQNFGQSCYHFY